MTKNIPAEGLYNACLDGDAAAVSRLLPRHPGTRLNLSGPRFQHPNNKCVPLVVAATYGHTEIVRMILERAPNTNVDYVDADGDAATLGAALFHHADILRLLADHGANVSLADPEEGWTPLSLAVARVPFDAVRARDPDPGGARQLSTVKTLLRLGAGTLPPLRAPGATPVD
jgi:ankyrin repeat protein